MTTSSDLQKLSVTGIVTLYELDATSLGAGIYRWHGHVGREDWLRIYDKVGGKYTVDETQMEVRNDIIWQGETYSPVSIQSDGLEVRGDGRASTPTLTLASDRSEEHTSELQSPR